MKRLRRARFVILVVIDRRAQLARDILDQRAGKKDVEALYAEAYRQDRLLFRKAVLQQREVDSLAVSVRLSALGVSGGPKSRRIHICGAAREHHGVKRRGELAHLLNR